MKPCLICDQPGAGNHFGVNSCRACAAFFRRGALRKKPYTCKNEAKGRCGIYDPATEQYSCKKCRMEKCLRMGMSVKRFQFGRDWIGPPEEISQKRKPKVDDGPKYIRFVETKHKKNFVELKFLLQEAENVLLNYKPTLAVQYSSTLLTLTNAINSVRDQPSHQKFRQITKYGVLEKLKDWEKSFFTVAKFFTHFNQFQDLPISLRMKIFTGVWHIFAIFDRLALNFIARKNRFASDENIFIPGYNTYFDFRNLNMNLIELSKNEEEISKRFIYSIDWYMINFIKPLLDLNPNDVELTFMSTQFCFNYAGKRFQGEIQEITENFQEILANDLHDYYVNDQNNMRYSARLGQLMKFVRSLENDFLEKQQKVEVGEVFDVWKVEFSHPEVFKDNLC
ncbi:unnamed protein product [Caenorhabditis brenneri]